MPTGVYVRTKSWAIPVKDRFWDKVKKGKRNECWPWTAACGLNGYGIASKTHDEKAYAHRVCWEIVNGPIPKGLHVLHRCDNRPCCNPKHLFLGTNTDNHKDKVSKGRQARGEMITVSKLTTAQVLAVRADPRFQHVIAAELGVDQSLISRIKNREVWKHV